MGDGAGKGQKPGKGVQLRPWAPGQLTMMVEPPPDCIFQMSFSDTAETSPPGTEPGCNTRQPAPTRKSEQISLNLVAASGEAAEAEIDSRMISLSWLSWFAKARTSESMSSSRTLYEEKAPCTFQKSQVADGPD